MSRTNIEVGSPAAEVKGEDVAERIEGTILTETAYAADGQQRTFNVGGTIFYLGDPWVITSIEAGKWSFSDRQKVVLVAVADDGFGSRIPLHPFYFESWPAVLSTGHLFPDPDDGCEKCAALVEDGPFCVPGRPLSLRIPARPVDDDD